MLYFYICQFSRKKPQKYENYCEEFVNIPHKVILRKGKENKVKYIISA